MLKLLRFICFLVLPWSFWAQGDDCGTATPINNVQNYCSGNGVFTNVGSTPGTYGLPTCWPANATEDVWFSFTALGTDVLISASGIGGGGTMSQPRIALYDGICGGLMNELNCSNGTPGFGTTQIYEGALVPGNTYYIRVSTPQANEGSFELCINSYTPTTNPGADCGGAAFLCNQNPVSVGTLGGGGLNNDEPEPGTCLDMPGPDESNSSWFYWTCGTGGPLTFDITPVNPMDDIDFIFYQLNTSNPCGARTPVRCCSSSCLNATGSTGMGLAEVDQNEFPGCQAGYNAYIQSITMTPGTSYALLVNNFSANTGFTLTFNNNNPNGGTFAGPVPQITSSNLTICTGDSVVFNGTSSQNCAIYNWNFTPNASPSSAVGVGSHTITYPNAGTYVAILNGLDNTGCQSLDYVNVTVNPPVQVIIAAVDTICSGANFIQNITSSPAGATFSYTPSANPNLTGANPGAGGSINQIINNTSNSAQNITYVVNANLNGCQDSDSCILTVTPLVEPNFNVMGPYCLGLIPAPMLPASSTNAIQGTWNPLAVNTQQLGSFNYTFNPTPGQCADSASLTVQISDNPGVSFSADNLLGCSPLQGTLTTPAVNGATYLWQINGQQAGNTATVSYNLPNVGCYDVELQVDISGCAASALLSDYLCVEGTPVVGFSFVPGEFTSPSELVSFNNGTQGASSYVWQYGDGNSSNQPEGTHTYTNTTGGYFVTLIASSPSGCIDSLTQFIGYQEPLIYYVPNTFTPDQDQFNQQWKPIFTSGFDPYDYHLSIFNRWGELIWESFNSETGWDGVYGKDFQAQEGIYTWEITFATKTNTEKQQITGTLNLLR
jgi:gliding motility-associated-like protein